MDVATAFLNGELDEKLFMEVPAGFRDPNRPNLVCRLLKALYALKTSSSPVVCKIPSLPHQSLELHQQRI